MTWGSTQALVEGKEPGCGAGRELRAPPKAKRPRGVVFCRLIELTCLVQLL